MTKLENKQLEESSDILLQSLQEFFTLLGKHYNSTVHDRIAQDDGAANIGGRWCGKRTQAIGGGNITVGAQHAQAPRAVDAFILPATELMKLPNSELPSRAKLSLRVQLTAAQAHGWSTTLSSQATKYQMHSCRGLFKDVVGRTRHDFDDMPEPMRLIAGGQSFAGTVRSLVAEKHALVQKIVDQQEAIQNNLARDLQ